MIRLFRDEDLSAVYEIYRYYVLYSSAIFDIVPQSEEEFGQGLSCLAQDMPVFVSEVEGELIGYGYIHPAFSKQAYEFDFELTIYFRPGRHYGQPRRMLGLLESAAVQMHGVWLISCITADNRASIAFHQRNGFVFQGEMKQAGLKNGVWHGICWFGKQISRPELVVRHRWHRLRFEETDLYNRMQNGL